MIVDLYSGPRGWSMGLRALGLTDVGIEIDPAACATARAAGHATIRADVARYPIDHLAGRVDGLIASPPCQAFSTAGNGQGRDAVPELAAAIHRGDWSWSHDDDRVRHVLEVGRWAETIRPIWITCEQVPPVLPLWEAYAQRWRHRYGWSCWAGILNAADYGVPQTRRRALLIARTDGRPGAPPAPTHSDGGALTLAGPLEPWVTMADALGWGSPPDSLTYGHRWPWRRPSPTIAGTNRVAHPHHRGDDEPMFPAGRVFTTAQVRSGDVSGDGPMAVKVSAGEALILQCFPRDYPVQGTRTKQFEQIGNAVPPPLAAAVISAVTGQPAQEVAA